MPWYRQAACDICPHEANSPHDSSPLPVPKQAPSNPPPAPLKYPYSIIQIFRSYYLISSKPSMGSNQTLIRKLFKTTIITRRKRRAARGASVLCERAPREGSQPHNWMSLGYIELCRLQMVSGLCDSFCRRGGPRARPTRNRMISLIQ